MSMPRSVSFTLLPTVHLYKRPRYQEQLQLQSQEQSMQQEQSQLLQQQDQPVFDLRIEIPQEQTVFDLRIQVPQSPPPILGLSRCFDALSIEADEAEISPILSEELERFREEEIQERKRALDQAQIDFDRSNTPLSVHSEQSEQSPLFRCLSQLSPLLHSISPQATSPLCLSPKYS